MISACVDRVECEYDHDKHLHLNNELAVDVLSLIDGVKECLEKKLKVNFKDIEDQDMEPVENVIDGLTSMLYESKKGRQISMSIKRHADAAL